MKRDNIIYWVTTGLIALMFLFSSVLYLIKAPELIQNFKQIGIPLYFISMLGVFKLLGALAILNPWSEKLKEWAYAGFGFTLIGAVWVHIATGTPFVAPLIVFVLLLVSYIYFQKIKPSITHTV